MSLNFNLDLLRNDAEYKELYDALTEKILVAGKAEGDTPETEDKPWWSGYAEALCWVRDHLLKLEKPEGES